MKDQLTELLRSLALAWDAKTSATPELWTWRVPSRGQCAVTALVVQDALGGELLRTVVHGESHYFNRLPTGNLVDLTVDQYLSEPDYREPDYRGAESRTRDYVLSFPDTKRRYELLRMRLMEVGQ